MSLVGSKGYCAPEVLRQEAYGTKSDVFSFAIILFEAVSCRSAKKFLKGLQQKSLSVSYLVPELNSQVKSNKAMRILIEKCWAEKPQDRPTFDEIIEALEKKEN